MFFLCFFLCFFCGFCLFQLWFFCVFFCGLVSWFSDDSQSSCGSQSEKPNFSCAFLVLLTQRNLVSVVFFLCSLPLVQFCQFCFSAAPCRWSQFPVLQICCSGGAGVLAFKRWISPPSNGSAHDKSAWYSTEKQRRRSIELRELG